MPSTDPPGASASGGRIAAIDIVRGAVMVLMAVDHVRVYSGVPAGGPTAGVFFTRWITHFCAPAFVFLAGTSAFLYGRKLANDRATIARYLVTRGLILVILEPTLIRASWTFSLDYSQFILAGVIWMLGWCMILLAGLIWLPTWAIGTLGLAVIVVQDVFGAVGGALPDSWRPVWEFIYPVGAEVKLGAGGPEIAVLYTIVPWIGVMAAGYAFGAIVTRDAATRRRLCLRIGLSATALFLIFGVVTVLLNPAPGRCAARSVQTSEPTEVPRVGPFSADDARAHDRGTPAGGARAWLDRRRAGDVRARADVLLPAAHPRDSRHGARRLADPGRKDPYRAVRDRPVCLDPARTTMESRALVSGLLRRRCRAVPGVPVVRAPQGTPAGWLVAISVVLLRVFGLWSLVDQSEVIVRGQFGKIPTDALKTGDRRPETRATA